MKRRLTFDERVTEAQKIFSALPPETVDWVRLQGTSEFQERQKLQADQGREEGASPNAKAVLRNHIRASF